MPTTFRSLHDGEQELIRTLLSVAFPGRDALVEQVSNMRGRTIDGDGSLELRVLKGPRAAVVRRIPVEAQVEDVDRMMIHVLLHVVDGYAMELELYRDDSRPVQGGIDPAGLEVIVL